MGKVRVCRKKKMPVQEKLFPFLPGNFMIEPIAQNKKGDSLSAASQVMTWMLFF